MRDRISIPVAELDVIRDHHTLWIHDAQGQTVLRIKTIDGKVRIKLDCSAPGPHADIIVKSDIDICIPPGTSRRKRAAKTAAKNTT